MLELRKDAGAAYHLEDGNDYVKSKFGKVFPIKIMSKLPMANVNFEGIKDGIQDDPHNPFGKWGRSNDDSDDDD